MIYEQRFKVGDKVRPNKNNIKICKSYKWDGVTPLIVTGLSQPTEKSFVIFDLPQYKGYAIYSDEMELVKKPIILITE